jgi:hypothetical protein
VVDMTGSSTLKTIMEPAREIKVVRECDVVVVGGGPGGFGAALAAARNGADTVLIERYGHLGGMASGGLVTIVPNMTGFNGEQYINGICGEWIDKLDAKEATGYPAKELGSKDRDRVRYWLEKGHFFVRQGTLVKSVFIDAEVCKYVLNDMFEEAGLKTYLHSWGTAAIMEKNEVQGIVFESKSGRQAILARTVIDATGDGDLLPSSGAEFEEYIDSKLRIKNLSMSYWIANVNLAKAEEFKKTNFQKYAELTSECGKLGGYNSFLKSNLKDQESVVWVHNKMPVSSQTNVEELTRTEFEGRKKMRIMHDFFKKNIPGFEHSFIIISDPQLGTRGARRVLGEIKLTARDMDEDKVWEDTIAVFPDLDRGQASEKHPLMNIPYRCMVPRKVENLLVACRAFSSDDVFNNYFNLIPHCVALGQAAGAAAALAVKEGVKPRKVNYAALQHLLSRQGVTLPLSV